MILTVLVIASVLLGIALVTGFLVLVQLRQSGNLSNSSKALYAAESGAEWYKQNQNSANPIVHPNTTNATFSSGANYTIETISESEARVTGRFGSSRKILIVRSRLGGNQPKIPCGDADVMIVIDRSNSMFDKFGEARDAAKNFIDQLDLNNKIGLVYFDDDATNLVHLTSNFNLVKNNIDGITLDGSDPSNLASGIIEAKKELDNPGDGHDRDDTISPDFLVIFTDGNLQSADGTAKAMYRLQAQNAAALARIDDITIFVVGIGTAVDDEAFLRQNIASSANHFIDGDATGWQDELLQKIECYGPAPGGNAVLRIDFPADIVLVIDRPPLSLPNLPLNPTPLETLKASLVNFVTNLMNSQKVGHVEFSSGINVSYPMLTVDPPDPTVITRINNITADVVWQLNLAAAINRAQIELVGINGRTPDNAYPNFMIIIANGNATSPAPNPWQSAKDAANLAKAAGTTIYVVTVNSDILMPQNIKDNYRDLSSGPGYYFHAYDYGLGTPTSLDQILLHDIFNLP